MSLGRSTVIAGMRFLCIPPSGRESELTIEIGEPTRLDEHEAVCAVTICGASNISDTPKGIHGEGTLQALCLALSFARTMLRDLQSKGCAIVDPDSRAAVDLDALFGRTHG